MIQLHNSLIFFDIESTGLDVVNDRIIEIYARKYHTNGKISEYHQRFFPEGRKSNPEAVEKHGITDIELIDEPAFAEKAEEVYNFFAGCDLSGYNLRRFDIQILMEELMRFNRTIDFSKSKILDVFQMVRHFDSHQLSKAYERYLGKPMENAHEAKADVEATISLMDAIMEKNELSESSSIDQINELVLKDHEKNFIDVGGKFISNDENEILFNFGKYKGDLLKDVLKKDPKYVEWIGKSDLPRSAKMIVFLGKQHLNPTT